MLIRSQNKELLVNFNVSAGIEIEEGTTKTVVTSYITGCSYLLGEYFTKAKAMKVLDMIQEAYERYEYEKVFKTGLTLFETFQMPDDSDVEV